MPVPPDTGLLHLLYLYFIPFWLFRDARHGDALVREQNYRYNRSRRKYLPGYLLKWGVICTLLLVGHVVAKGLVVQQPAWEGLWQAWALCTGVGFSVGVVLMVNILVIWGFLTLIP